MGAITLQNIEKWFGDTQVIKGIDLDIHDGEFVVFVGPSGCGKSTLLRMIAGLEDASRGKIFLDDKDVTALPPSGRRLSMVFQSYALYPHMSVGENMGFGLKVAGSSKSDIHDKVKAASKILKLDNFLDRRPKDLSGGQRQRVAIGRAIVREPKGFLFDEPLSNLDASLRVEMRFEIARLHDTLGSTMIYVTHDQVEAMTLADKIVVLKDGLIMQVGTPRDLYEKPQNLFVAQFIGSPQMNVMAYNSVSGIQNITKATKVGIRPEHIGITVTEQGNVSGHVEFTEYLGSDSFVYVNCDGVGAITVRCRDKVPPNKGDNIGLVFDIDNTYFFDIDDNVI